MLRNRYFLFLWFVTIATTLAIKLFMITILVTVYEQTESTLQAVDTMVARTMPAFFTNFLKNLGLEAFLKNRILVQGQGELEFHPAGIL
ncbi:MAG: hypothetical protein DRH90_02810 [Deltaproteobacteria bacterium]|nr:MAG: hypothetical protein DRH90_02810 [Deltaproteobacteria bacterium]